MKTTIDNKNITDILMAKTSNGDIWYKASTIWVPESDFIQTGLKWFPERGGLKLDYLAEDDTELIGTDLVDLQHIEASMFPTLEKEEEGEGRHYFGSYIYQPQEIFSLTLAEGIEWIDFYEYQEDTVPGIRIEFEDTEITSSKTIFLLITYAESMTVDISYRLWLEDPEGNQKKPEVLLKNDSFKTVESPVRKGEEGFLWSMVSGSLAGTKKLDSRPLYDRICSLSTETWNPERIYGLGEKVKVGENEYQSLLPQNLGNHPLHSRAWINSGYLENVLNTPVQVLVWGADEGETPGTVSPYGTISIPYNISDPTTLYERTFNYTEGPGYELVGASLDHETIPESGIVIDRTAKTVILTQAFLKNVKDMGGYLYFMYQSTLGKISWNTIETGTVTTNLSLSELINGHWVWQGDTSFETGNIYYSDTLEILDKESVLNPSVAGGILKNRPFLVQDTHGMDNSVVISRVVVESVNEQGDITISEIKENDIESGRYWTRRLGSGGIDVHDNYTYICKKTPESVLYPKYYLFFDQIRFEVTTIHPENVEVSGEYIEVSYGASKDVFFYITDGNADYLHVNVEGDATYTLEGSNNATYRVKLTNIKSNIKITITC